MCLAQKISFFLFKIFICPPPWTRGGRTARPAPFTYSTASEFVVQKSWSKFVLYLLYLVTLSLNSASRFLLNTDIHPRKHDVRSQEDSDLVLVLTFVPSVVNRWYCHMFIALYLKKSCNAQLPSSGLSCQVWLIRTEPSSFCYINEVRAQNTPCTV
jgi:hypothetical protein